MLAVPKTRTRSLAICAVLLIVPAPATAQQGEDYVSRQERLERARGLFEQGVDCIDREQWICAEHWLREALSLRDASSIRYNLALALSGLGRYREASTEVAAVLADSETPANIRGPARELSDHLAESGGRLVIRIDAGDADALAVRVDGESLDTDQRSEPILVAAGERVVTLFRGEDEIARETANVTAGHTSTVVLRPPAIARVPTIHHPDPPLYEDWRFWTAIGAAVGVMAIVLIVIVAATASTVVQPGLEGTFQPGILRWQ